MQGYRDQPSSTPLLTNLGGLLIAVNPETGALLWSAKLEWTISRLVVAGDLVFLATRGNIHESSYILMLDLATGAQRGGFASGLSIEAAIAREDRVYFTGRDGSIALTSKGQMLWRIVSSVVKKDLWNGDTRELVGQDAAGRDLWRVPQASWGQAALVAHGDLVAQPDFEG